jgi:DNA recombination protein RmuC
MDNLARHIDLAKKDVEEVQTSSRKISDRFAKIERAELEKPPELAPPSGTPQLSVVPKPSDER